MAKRSKKKRPIPRNQPLPKSGPRKNMRVSRWRRDRRLQLALGFLTITTSVFLLLAFVSFFFTGTADQSVIESAREMGVRPAGSEVENWLGLLGAWASYQFMYKWFGAAALLLVPILFLAGYRLVFQQELLPLRRVVAACLFGAFWGSLTISLLLLGDRWELPYDALGGGFGYHLAVLLRQLVGWGAYLLVLAALAVFVVYFFGVESIPLPQWRRSPQPVGRDAAQDARPAAQPRRAADPFEPDTAPWSPPAPSAAPEPVPTAEAEPTEEAPPSPNPPAPTEEKPRALEVIRAPVEEETVVTEAPDLEDYDPTLELSRYEFPTLELLEDHEARNTEVTEEELQANSNRIEETLLNYKIGIDSIKATVGPTVTLYEIVPEAGIRISKIKNLEDDIALSLSALGIRIIAPIPGRGTIGIEVPNTNRNIVSLSRLMATEKFRKTNHELPVAIGRSISNEVFVFDLAKMPHLLMAGATGQGKSVGINTLITSLLYRKHPSQLKFVLVDPKKVELSLYSHLEKHFLAKLPDGEEAIITDTKKVINTLNSLCIEMDTRYDLLKNAGCRNLREYNRKFVGRRLNPEKGHRYLPYIVLIIDELADLMMTAGKEVETPIARLAQLARAIGIHLVVATQRPSVNVITGIIKANFPARISFKVTSKVDSRTILDASGAEQLVGMGDLLLSNGSDLKRLQCAFVDTPEVERVCEFIGEQPGYETAYVLPEYVGDEDNSGPGGVDLADRDPMFDDAARVIVAHQQGSTSLLQRRLKLGYNRAGRLVDQLEAAGIVGPFEGSKAREVLVSDEASLEQLLKEMH